MKRETLFLKLVVVVMGLVPLLFMAATIRDLIYGDLDGYSFIVAGIYVSAIPFWLALYQALKLLGFIDKNEAFSVLSVSTLKYIKYCALTISGLYMTGLPLLFDVADKDDSPGVLAIGLVIIGASFIIAMFAAVLQKLLQNAIDIKSENDLTV
jgi:hypothetical protein